MEDQDLPAPINTAVAAAEPAPQTSFEPAASSPIPVRRPSLAPAIITAALIIGGALGGSSYYVGTRIDALSLQIGDIGSAPSGAGRPPKEEAEPAPKVDASKLINSSDAMRGPKKAEVTIVEFSDYQCPYCGRFFEETLPILLKTYEGKVRFVFKDFPLPMHPEAPKASEAAHCAGDQDKYWEYHDILFANQTSLGEDALKGYARQLNLETQTFDACLSSGKYTGKVKEATAVGRGAGVNGTPTFFINGERLVGAQPIDEFKRRIDQILGTN